MTILVTGGAGFIGSNFLHHLTTVTDEEVICIDKLTYASKVENVPSKIKLYATDIADKNNCDFIFKRHKISTVFNFAAESHVDNSIKDCSEFVKTNIEGTINLLNMDLKYDVEKFIHVSTDEVFGSIKMGSFTEETRYDPRNPYSDQRQRVIIL